MINKVFFLLLIFTGVLLRLIPHEPNFVPVGAISLFAGFYFPKKYAIVLPIVILLVTDSIIGFHNTMVWVYGAYLLITLLGSYFGQSVKLAKIISFSLFSSILFFFITNFGVWATTNIYAHNAQGLIECFTLAVPFFRNTLLSDIFYGVIIFEGYKLFSESKKLSSFFCRFPLIKFISHLS